MVLKKLLILAGAALAFGGTASAADGWPQRSVRIIVPFGAGSTPDAIARIVADRLQQRVGKSIVVENKPGAGGSIGADIVAKAEPDGYTIGLGSLGPLVNNPLLYKRMSYDPFRDLAPITAAVSQPSVLVIAGNAKANNIKELVADMKQRPLAYNYASIGNGSLSHLTMELVAQRTGVDLVHVVYPGSGQVLPAIIGGHAQMAVLPALVVVPHAKAGKLKLMATAKRSPLLPELPSLKDEGLADFEIDTWFGYFAPAKTPPALIQQIHDEIVAVLRDPEVAALFRSQLMEVMASTPDEFSQLLREEQRRWKPVIAATGTSPN